MTRHHDEAKAKRTLAQLEIWDETNNNYTTDGFMTGTNYTTLFALYKNSSCVLAPEVTEGYVYTRLEQMNKS